MADRLINLYPTTLLSRRLEGMAETNSQLAALIAQDKQTRLIVNARNFGHIRSPYHGLLQAHGDACILIATDRLSAIIAALDAA